MQMLRMTMAATLVACLGASPASAQDRRQTQEDDYTRYELLAPASGRFRIAYEVTATTPGATFFYNPIRPGSVASDERVIDMATGEPLAWEIVSGEAARVAGHPSADPGTSTCRRR